MALTNSQYDSVMREYNKRQIENQHKLNNNIEAVYKLDERFSKIDETIADLSIEYAKRLLNGDKHAVIKLRTHIIKYTKERNVLLESLGFPKDFLKPDYTCPDCKDTGYINGLKCHCFKKTATDVLYSQSNIKNILDIDNFNNFSYEYYSDSIIDSVSGLSALDLIKKAVSECKHFIDKFDKEFNNIFLYGDTGVGKTFLSNSIAKELLNKSHSVIYFTAFEIFDILAKNTFDKKNSTDNIYDYLFDCDLLIIDDLGTELTNSFISSQLFLCVNERILRKKPTIISTNLSLDSFAEIYSERTFSRISSNYTMLKLIGNDIRILKRLR